MPLIGNMALSDCTANNNVARELDEIYKDLHELELKAVEGGSRVLEKKESLENEKQISVDPISLRESSIGEVSFSLMLPPADTAAISFPVPPPLQPAKPKFLSYSLPNSAYSSPRFSSVLLKKKWKNESEASRQSPRQVRKHSAADFHQALLRSSLLRRSKSCGEGGASTLSDDFDLWPQKPNASQHHHDDRHQHHSSFTNGDAKKDGNKKRDTNEDEFKCSALCLFLPGFGKGKPVRARQGEVVSENGISRTVSLEKFECGSWASSAIIQDQVEDRDSMSMNLYFDLPLELIRNDVNDANSPVSAAFVFDKDVKGVLKNGSAKATPARKSHDSSRHVRFSTQSPASPASCITPRLRKAREDFNAFLEAQSA